MSTRTASAGLHRGRRVRPAARRGERYADKLRDAGVQVTLRRHSGLIHAFTNTTGVGRTGREAMLEVSAPRP